MRIYLYKPLARQRASRATEERSLFLREDRDPNIGCFVRPERDGKEGISIIEPAPATRMAGKGKQDDSCETRLAKRPAMPLFE